MMWDNTGFRPYIEVFTQLLDAELEHAGILKGTREFDASLLFSYETTAPPELITAMRLPLEDTLVFAGFIFPFEEIDVAPRAILRFFSAGSIAELLRARILDGSLEESESGEDAFLHVRLRRHSGKWITRSRAKQGQAPVERPALNFEITHVYYDFS